MYIWFSIFNTGKNPHSPEQASIHIIEYRYIYILYIHVHANKISHVRVGVYAIYETSESSLTSKKVVVSPPPFSSSWIVHAVSSCSSTKVLIWLLNSLTIKPSNCSSSLEQLSPEIVVSFHGGEKKTNLNSSLQLWLKCTRATLAEDQYWSNQMLMCSDAQGCEVIG